MATIRRPVTDNRRAHIICVLRVFLGAVFVLAGGLKVANSQAFAASVAGFGVTPRSLSNLIAMVLPPFEILCGMFLMRGRLWRPAALGIFGMNVLFVAVLSHAWASGHSLECGCFGKWDPFAGKPGWAIGRDCVFLAIAAILWSHGSRDAARHNTLCRSEYT
jgi:uncharacterized membrane protein YphA (DoxX/SURF4 family)